MLSVGEILVHISVCCCCVALWLMWNFSVGWNFSVCVRGRAPCGVLVLVESKKKVEVTVLVIQSMYSM